MINKKFISYLYNNTGILMNYFLIILLIIIIILIILTFRISKLRVKLKIPDEYKILYEYSEPDEIITVEGQYDIPMPPSDKVVVFNREPPFTYLDMIPLRNNISSNIVTGEEYYDDGDDRDDEDYSPDPEPEKEVPRMEIGKVDTDNLLIDPKNWNTKSSYSKGKKIIKNVEYNENIVLKPMLDKYDILINAKKYIIKYPKSAKSIKMLGDIYINFLTMAETGSHTEIDERHYFANIFNKIKELTIFILKNPISNKIPKHTEKIKEWVHKLLITKIFKKVTLNKIGEPVKFFNNVELDNRKILLEYGIDFGDQVLIESCLNDMRKHMKNCFVNNDSEFRYISLTDISRHSRSLSYTESSLSWMRQILAMLNKYYKDDTSGISVEVGGMVTVFNNMVEVFNDDIKSTPRGALMQKYKETYFKSNEAVQTQGNGYKKIVKL